MKMEWVYYWGEASSKWEKYLWPLTGYKKSLWHCCPVGPYISFLGSQREVGVVSFLPPDADEDQRRGVSKKRSRNESKKEGGDMDLHSSSSQADIQSSTQQPYSIFGHFGWWDGRRGLLLCKAWTGVSKCLRWPSSSFLIAPHFIFCLTSCLRWLHFLCWQSLSNLVGHSMIPAFRKSLIWKFEAGHAYTQRRKFPSASKKHWAEIRKGQHDREAAVIFVRALYGTI